MTDQQTHLTQLVEQRTKLTSDLETLGSQSTRTRELFLKTQGAIEYLEAVGVKLPEPEVTEESEESEESEVVEEQSSAKPASKRAKKG